MNSAEIRSRYLKFFEKRGHKIIPSASVVPANDPTVLFNTAGMQPLVPYLLGEKHPAGKRLVDAQKCIRTVDIDDVGDNRHLTFFEMLGNWSLGDYFKADSIPWSFEFLTDKTEGLGLDPQRLYVTVFKGEDGIPRDEESIKIWQQVFSQHNLSNKVSTDETIAQSIRIIPLGVADNFWIAGPTGPCGGDTEMFYDTNPGAGELKGKFSDLVDSGRLIEIWNNVFIEFNKLPNGTYQPLEQKNVDTGMGLERTTAVINGEKTVFETDLFEPILKKINELSSFSERSAKIVADHIKAAVFMIADGITPSNTDRGYVLRRLLRRAVLHADKLRMPHGSLFQIAESVIGVYQDVYPEINNSIGLIESTIDDEEQKFRRTLEKGSKEIEKILALDVSAKKVLPSKYAFDLYQTHGVPVELTEKIMADNGVLVNRAEIESMIHDHQERSRIGAAQKFKGGLADTSEMSVKYHTATHLLNAALREVLGPEVMQKGSNITPERLRFDFNYPNKLTDEQKKAVEDLVNQKIRESLPVTFQEMPREEAEKTGAVHAFGEKYGEQVKVYSIGNKEAGYFSREFCGGPHVKNTGELGTFKITKEEAVAAGTRRIKAILL